MAFASWISDLIGGGASKIIDSVAGAADKFITTDEDRQKFEIERQKAALEIQRMVMEAESKQLADVQGAREMYAKDSTLQKTFAITFLVAYCALTVIMVAFVFIISFKAIMLPEWATLFIGTLYGAMTSKIGTITDFLFGSSKGSRDKDEAVSKAYAQATAP